MTHQAGNLSGGERAFSALTGLSFAILALRGGSPLSRVLNGVTGAALLARSYAGHCGMKAAIAGEASLREGMAQQWGRMRPMGGPWNDKQPRASSSDAVDAGVNDSSPASDPPASRIPDEPPVNVEDQVGGRPKRG
jgi:Protein of unknown function (DUF2892)